MLRRTLILTTALLLAAEPSYSQSWMQRYLDERKAKKAAEQEEAQEVRKAEPVETPEVTTDAAPDASGQTVRRAEVADPEPATDPTQTVRRAEPVTSTPESATPEPETPAPPAKPTPVVIVSTPPPPPNPTPATVVPTPTPKLKRTLTVQPTVTPAPTAAPTATPAVAAVASPTPEPNDELDPKTNVIRIAPSNKPTPPDISQFNYANSYYTKKDYDRAAAEYERYLTLYPTAPDRQAAMFRMAESNRQRNNLNAAHKIYELLLTEFMDGDFVGPAAYRLADLCFDDKNYPDALAYYRKASVRVKDPEVALSAKYRSARCLEALGDTSEAIDAYQELLATPGNNPFLESSRLALARMLAQSGRKTDAQAQYDLLIKETSKDSLKAEATVRESLLWIDMGQPAKAIEGLNRALKMPELGSWKETALVSLLRAYYSAQNYKQVLETYRPGEQQYSAEAQPEVLLIVANSNRQLDKESAARPLYEQIIRDYPTSPYVKDAQYYRLVTLYNANAPELSGEIDTYLAQNPDSSDKRDQLLLLKAESLYKTGKYAVAAPIYASLADSSLTSPLKTEALFKRGWCYTQQQPRDNAAAIQVFSEFLKQNPAHKLAPTALAQRAISYQQSKNLKAALADFNSILDRYPKAPKERSLAYEQKALILGQDDNQAMADTFTKFLGEFPSSPVAGKAHYWIGRAAFDSKNYKASIPSLETARKLDQEHFGEKSTRLLIQANRILEDRKGTAAEVDKAEANKTKVPAEILRWLGTEAFKAGDTAQAGKYLTQLTARDGTEELQTDDWLILGCARTKEAKWSEAETALKTYLGKVSEPVPQARGHLALGEAQLGAKQFDEAKKSADAALALQPEGKLNAQGLMLSGDIAFARSDFAESAKLYTSVSVLFSDDAEITPKALTQAWKSYKKTGNEAQAAKTLNELQSHFPEYPVPKAD
jgi:TolA-binding protein